MSEREMDTLVWTALRKMEMRRAPVPVPAKGEVLLEVTAAGVCGSDVHGFMGMNSLRTPPLVMGHEAAGRVAGDDAHDFTRSPLFLWL